MKLRFAISVTQVIGVYTHTDVQKFRVGLNFNVFEKKSLILTKAAIKDQRQRNILKYY